MRKLQEKRPRKNLKTVFALLACATSLLLLYSPQFEDAISRRVTNKVLPILLSASNVEGILKSPPTIEEAGVRGAADFFWKGIAMNVIPHPKSPFAQFGELKVAIQSANAKPNGIKLAQWNLSAEQIVIAPAVANSVFEAELPDGKAMQINAIIVSSIAGPLKSSDTELSERVLDFFKAISTLLEDGSTVQELELSGMLSYQVDSRPGIIHFKSNRNQNLTRIALDFSDLELMSRNLSRPFSQSELRLVAEFPFRAPKMLALKHNAKLRAPVAVSGSPGVEIQEYEMLLCGYLIAKEFGAGFSAQVLETRPEAERTQGGLAEAWIMGARFAEAQIAEPDLLKRYRELKGVLTK